MRVRCTDRTRATLIVFLLVSLEGGCSTNSGCPPGLMPKAGTCVPIPDTTPLETIVVRDDGATGPEDLAEIQAEADVQTDGRPADDSGGPTDALPGGFIGLPCSKEADCRKTGADGVCLDWVGGYCTILDCGGTGAACPDGAVCLGITPNKPACAQACQDASDCRPGGAYGCKAIADPSGALQRVCYQVRQPGGTGEGCAGHQDCAGDASCLTTFAGGYCAVLGCGADVPCPEDAVCALVNGVPACLKRCAQDEDCTVAANVPRRCAAMKSVLNPGEKVNACISGTGGVAIGGPCLNDMDCASEQCNVVATGRCSASGDGCRQDQDCPNFGEVCVQSAEYTFGYCTKKCSLSVPCAGQAFCIGQSVGASGQAEGQCVPGCLEPGDKTCRPEVGLTCIFGDPVNAPGHYACAPRPRGAAGSFCKAPSDCESGQCLIAAGGGGYCTAPCGFQGFCAFPTLCEQAGGQTACYLRCLSSLDCPAGHACKQPAGATAEICYPQ